jgi:hypothetical protein
MRTRRALPLTLLIVAAVSATPALAGGKLAASHPLSWTDTAGDANAINDQGLPAPVPGDNSGPAQWDAADIVGVTFARIDDGKKVLGLTVTMKLSGAPSQGVLYRVTGAAGACSTFWFQYNWTAGGTGAPTLRHNCVESGSATAAVSDTVSIPIDGKAVGNSIVWTLLVKQLPPGVKIGSVITPDQGEVRGILGAANESLITAPVIDQTPTQTAAYKIGQ